MSSQTLRRMSSERQRASQNYNRRRGKVNSNTPPKARKKRFGLFSIGMGIDLPFLITILVLLVIGLIMMFSASYPVAYYNNGDSFYFLKRQILFAVIGVTAMMGISYIDYHILHKMAYVFLGLSYFALILVLVLPSEQGVHRWIGVGGYGIQASEFSKFAIVLFLAHWGSLYYEKMNTIKYGVMPALVVFVSTALLLILEPHYSGIVIVLLLTITMLFLAGIKTSWLIVAGIAAVVAFLIAWATGILSYAMTRMEGWGQALEYTNEKMWQTTWQTRNSLYAIGSGGFFGLGLGNSRQKYLYLPEPQNDFIFAIVCEELGLVGAIVILLIFAVLVWRGISLSLRAPDRFGRLLGIGLTSQIGIQVILNIFVITDWLPNTGISLPFFSYGGSSLVVLLAQMGVVLSISRHSNIEKA
ncbi:MAG: putative peptidoglycan glycosyltransferase FtsW [Ruminococcus sp.]|nr:putative peptidoglycan glycosyltransferase FtsW [Ruminococcus sp.]